MTDEEETPATVTAAEAAKATARKKLRAAVGRVASERTTKSGKACVAAAKQLIDMGELVEARHWISLSLTADKAQADVKLKEALDKLEKKGAKAESFRSARKGAKATPQAEG